jgi:glutathione S-transferase
MITVHHLNHSRSQRVLWLLEELELPYEIKRYERDPKTMLAPGSLRAVHPLGKSPVITDDDRVIAESGAILEYVAARYGEGRLVPPSDSDAALRCRYWLHYAEGSLMPLLLMKLVFGQLQKGPVPFFVKPIAKALVGGLDSAFLDPQLGLHLGFIEGELAKHSWFAGDAFTIADIQMSYGLEAASSRGGLDARYPRAAGVLARMRARPAYQRALQKGGPVIPGD